MLPLLVLTPHSSAYVPVNVLTQMLGTTRFNNAHRTTFLEHLYFESDPYTDLIFHFPEAHFLAAKVSRFVVDVNRYRDDSSANGIIKLTDFNQIPLYPEGFSLSKKEREERLQRYFDSFHAELKALLASRPIRLLIDGHCMAPFGPNLGPDKGKARPAFTIMTGGDTQGEAVAGQRFASGFTCISIITLQQLQYPSNDGDGPPPTIPSKLSS